MLTPLRIALDVGDAFNQAKKQVPDKKWGKWLRYNCFLSIRMAQLYMQLADHRDEIEAEIARFDTLSIRQARKLIARSKPAPEEGEVEPVTEPVAEPMAEPVMSAAVTLPADNLNDDDRLLAAIDHLSDLLEQHRLRRRHPRLIKHQQVKLTEIRRALRQALSRSGSPAHSRIVRDAIRGGHYLRPVNDRNLSTTRAKDRALLQPQDRRR
jgi:hypothetical protein